MVEKNYQSSVGIFAKRSTTVCGGLVNYLGSSIPTQVSRFSHEILTVEISSIE